MKKLSIILALIMALSCFGLVASAGNVNVTLKAVDKDDNSLAADVAYVQAAGTITEADILAKAATVAGYEAVAVKDAGGNILKSVAIADGDAPIYTVVYAAVPSIEVTIHFDAAFVNGENDISTDLTYHEHVKADEVLNFTAKIGTVLTAADILTEVKKSEKVDPAEYTLAEKVFKADKVFASETLEGDKEYKYDVYAVEINDVENFAIVVASEVAGYNWGAVANANVALINQIISGLKAAVESLCNADWPTCEPKTEAEATTAVVDTPKTGSSAVAGAAIVVLALSAATAVVLRKKED